jgi:hypothetical protein
MNDNCLTTSTIFFFTLVSGFAGWLILKHRLLVAAWMLLPVTWFTTDVWFREAGALQRMIAFILVSFPVLKSIIGIHAARAGQRLTVKNWFLFNLWPGMHAKTFIVVPLAHGREWLAAMQKGLVSAGIGIAAIACALELRERFPGTAPQMLAAFCLLTGCSMVLHFGALNIVAALWRAGGREVGELFRSPLESRTLAEFWGKRWNTAFSEMTTIAVFRPVCKVVPRPVAVLTAFLFSGILHELAISLPVRQGFGGPTLYFLLQGVLSLAWQRTAFSNRFYQRLITVLSLLVPLPLLFHQAFLDGVLWPLVTN